MANVAVLVVIETAAFGSLGAAVAVPSVYQQRIELPPPCRRISAHRITERVPTPMDEKLFFCIGCSVLLAISGILMLIKNQVVPGIVTISSLAPLWAFRQWWENR